MKPRSHYQKRTSLCLMLLWLTAAVQAKEIYRVSPDGTGDGSSWSSTTTLVKALDTARDGDEIWVQGFEDTDAPGHSYIVPTDLPNGFVVREGVRLYGGFAGTEQSIEERVTAGDAYRFAYRSVLSGDRNGDDVLDAAQQIFPSNTTRKDNALHIIYMESGTGNTTTTIDGFTIAHGNASATGMRGGGIYVTGKGGNYAIKRCFLIDNYATRGGAVYVEEDAGTATSTISLCCIFNNAAGQPSSAVNDGGGICVAGFGRIDNTLIYNNSNGGLLLSAGTTVVNTTIVRNTAAGIDLLTPRNGNDIQVYNTVVWGNTTIYSAHRPGMSHCGYPRETQDTDTDGNIHVSEKNNEQSAFAPYFSSPSPKLGFNPEAAAVKTGYPQWNWSFPYNSVLTDKGVLNSVTIAQNNTDLTGAPRISNGTTDIGAYEYQAVSAERIRYVKPDGTGNGLSWDDAMGDLQKAIDDLAATPDVPGEVWVAKGVYEPQTQIVTGKEETVYFLVHDGISIYGGFAGNETAKNERLRKTDGMPWEFVHETILQGSHYNGECSWNASNYSWEPTSNSRHILWLAPQTGKAPFRFDTEVNGVTIQGGYADGDGDAAYVPGRGAGVYMEQNTSLTNCIVKENRAYDEGGGIFNHAGTVEACLIYNNTSIHSDGGGVFLDNAGLVRRCAVINNSGHNGGGIYMDCNRVMDDRKFHPEYLILTSSVISNNHSTENGAVFCNKGGVVLQSTIANNFTPRATDNAVSDASQTGGLYANEYALVVNSIIWNNINNTNRVPMYALSPTVSTVRFINTAISDVGYAVWNNILQQDNYMLESGNTASTQGYIAPYFSWNGNTMVSDNALQQRIGIQEDWKSIDYFWTPRKGSPLRALGRTLAMFPEEVLITPEVDVTGELFSMKPSVGAVHIDAQPIVPEDTGNTLRIYVNDTYTDPDHDGHSWAYAYRSLNEALAHFAALPETEIQGKNLEVFVQEHTSMFPRYYFTNDDPQTGTINIPRTQSGQPILIRGGFSAEGGEDRTYNPMAYHTIINGNPDGTDMKQGLYHCVTVAEGAETVMEGFHIINGYAAEGAQFNYGAGMRVLADATVTLRDCIFENNSGMTAAAVDASDATLLMENCVVNNNTCTDATSALVIARNLTLRHVTFAHNIGQAYRTEGGKEDVSNTLAAGNTAGNTHDDITVSPENFANPTNRQGATPGFDTYLGGYSNFRPLTGSKLMADYVINKGTSSGLLQDIALNDRNLGGIPDLGAYEATLPRSGRVYYVRTDGNDNNDGLSWEHPFATIRKAVNTALQGEVIDNEHPQVWVAAGTYSQAPAGTSYNCFEIEDGVNVYGAFPKTGTPGMDDRHPLVSQRIYNNTPEYTADSYETILQPSTTTGNRRVLGQSDRYNPNASNASIANAGNFTYPTTWDGFTLQSGYLDSNSLKMLDNSGKRNGGAGAAIYKNVTLRNCVVYDNTNTSTSNGTEMRAGGVYCDQGTIVNCHILNNKLGTGTSLYTAYGGGCYMYEGTAYNCVISENTTTAQYGDGAGIFIEKAVFFNNTITHNTTTCTYRGSGGVCIWNSSGSSKLTIYNCIIVNNSGFSGDLIGNKDIAASGGVMNCYYSLVEDDTNKGSNNKAIYYENCTTVGTNPTRIFADADNKNYRLSGVAGLNSGINTPTIDGTTYNLFEFTDMDYNDRIQDCTIDAGAFERNNSDLITPGKDYNTNAYIYYVSCDGAGQADASAPEQAACAMKLQQVLTAAGRLAQENGYTRQIVVRIAGYDPEVNVYHANTLEYADNPMSYTYVVPYGITVEGGWNDNYKDNGKDIPSFTERNISRFQTTLSPVTTVGGQTVNGFHTLSFGAKPEYATGSEAVTLIDGLYLTGGSATSLSTLQSPNTRGGAAIVPAWGHIRRCIIYRNEATQGGGLYLLPGALVSGSLIVDNTAGHGGGIYAGQTDDLYRNGKTADADNRAHVFTSTIVRNTATGTGGGIFTEDGASFGQDLTVWGNDAPADKNMSGSFGTKYSDNLTRDMLLNTTKEPLEELFPYNNCFVETFEMQTSFDNNEAMTSEQGIYFHDDYTLKQYSPLIKSGMKTEYYNYLTATCGLAETDIYGLAYIQSGISKIDVGAYAFEGGVMIVDKTNLVTRIFVSKNARTGFTGSENINAYLGRSFLTPLNELDEALEYIKTAKAQGFEDEEFEIFITGGIYKPSFRRMDAPHATTNQRQNSFVVPQGVSIFGGFSGEEPYSFDLSMLKDEATGTTHNLSPKQEGDLEGILTEREASDFNGNGISEPWELANQTILSGNINASNSEKNVYHVIFTSDTHGNVLLDGLTITEGETSSDVQEQDNEVGRGGGIYTNSVNYTLNRCRLLNNKAVLGNAIYAGGASVTVNGTFFSGNSSVTDHSLAAGGAVYLSGMREAALRAFNSLWTNNETYGRGGIVATSQNPEQPTALLMVNNTVARNKAGMYAAADIPNGEVINTLIWGNEQGEEDGTAFNTGIHVRNSASEYELPGGTDNRNLRLNTINMEVDGPRFTAPSTVCGAAGESSTNQWNPAAISVLADAGDGTLDRNETDMLKATGAYIDKMKEFVTEYMPQYMGNKDYLRYAGPLDENGLPDDKPIDIGLYEYQYKLIFSDMDTVYVATYENGRADGTSWSNATSDLRGAIIALSHPTGNSSSNVSPYKCIHVRKGDYDYAISQLFANGVAFSLQMGTSEFGESLSIKGSYNNQGEQDFSNPSIITCNTVNAENTKQLMQINANGKRVEIEGFLFHNPNGKAVQTGAEAGGSVLLKNLAFRDNKEDAVHVNNNRGRILLVNTLIADGSATGIDCTGNKEQGEVTIINATFSHNHTDYTGTAGVYNSVSWENDVQNLTTEDGHFNANIPAGTANTDLENGPNFVDPLHEEVMQRDYRLRPSMTLLNRGDNTVYRTQTGLEEEEVETETDLNSGKRFVGKSIDVGAYEYATPLQPIIYVKSGMASGNHDGTSWSNATGDLQGAADLAGLYHYNFPEQNGYVFVHNNVADLSLTIQVAGAKIYGNMNDETPLHEFSDESHNGTTVREVVDDLLQKRKGMMETTAYSSLTDIDINRESLIDGFEIKGIVTVSGNGMVSSSILKDESSVEIREDGVLYNSFVDGDIDGKGGTVVNVTATGHVGGELATYNMRREQPLANSYISTEVWTYQLNEKSEDIDRGDLQDITPYMTFAGHRRDLAGNPRLLNQHVDNGCFETWNIPADNTWTTDDANKFYPISGSVVYLHEGANLVLNQSETFRPGYLLIRQEASLYGNGTQVQVPYVAVEKELSEGWNMLALPYIMTRTGIARTGYGDDTRVVLEPLSVSDSTEVYDGQARAASLYQYAPDNSPFWNAAATFAQSQGFAFKTASGGIYRFTGGEENGGNTVYTEDGTDKTVNLTQYDLKNVASDGTPNFTYKENMGWNLFGIPYLVSRYNMEDMDIPHVVYPYADGGYTTMQTWSDGESATARKTVGTGTGMFTQTATLGTSEKLIFPMPAPEAAPIEVNRNKYHLSLTGEDGEDRFIFGTTDRETDGEYIMGSDALKLMALRRTLPQLYATQANGNRFSLLNEVAENATVSLGIQTVAGAYTLSLGETADNDLQEEVWLTDRTTGKTVNLRKTDYHFTTDEEESGQRFTLAFSRLTDRHDAISIHTLGRTLYVEGVEKGKTINVYDTAGSLIETHISDGTTFRCPLTHGVYVVSTSAISPRKILIP